MYCKCCSNCGEKSYSATRKGRWECPTCGAVLQERVEENN